MVNHIQLVSGRRLLTVYPQQLCHSLTGFVESGKKHASIFSIVTDLEGQGLEQVNAK